MRSAIKQMSEAIEQRLGAVKKRAEQPDAETAPVTVLADVLDRLRQAFLLAGEAETLLRDDAARQLLGELRANGFEVWAAYQEETDSHIVMVDPGERLDMEDSERIRTHRQGLISVLRESGKRRKRA